MTRAEQLQTWIATLEAAQMGGVRSLRDQNGEQVEYQSGREMANALATARRELAALSAQPIRTIKFITSKGV